MYLPKLREIREALTSFFSAPYTTKFPAEPFTAAPEYRGKPRYQADGCVGCGTCLQVCPTGAITVADDLEAGVRTLTINFNVCMNCGQCEEHCITGKGVIMTPEHSLAIMDLNDKAAYEVIEHELLRCEGCGQVIAPRRHLEWVRDRLGAKAFAHPNFLLLDQERFTDIPPSHFKSRVRREDQIKQVCAKCRNRVVVADEF